MTCRDYRVVRANQVRVITDGLVRQDRKLRLGGAVVAPGDGVPRVFVLWEIVGSAEGQYNLGANAVSDREKTSRLVYTWITPQLRG